MQSKKVLIFTDWFVPGFKAGGPIQSCKNLVIALEKDFDFYVLTSDRDFGDKIPYKGLTTDLWTNFTEDTLVYYASGIHYKRNLLTLINEVSPDVVYFNNMFSVNYTLIPLWIILTKKLDIRVVLAPRGMLQAGALHQKFFKKLFFLKLFKLSGTPKRIIFHATDEQEKNDILKVFPNAGDVRVVGNIPSTNLTRTEIIQKDPGFLKCVFLSRFQSKKNLFFIFQILKSLDLNGAKIQFDIYGEIEDQPYYSKCLEIIKTLPDQFVINWKGGLEHSQVKRTLSQYHLFILPTLGENFGHSIYEALHAGVPVLISDKTPWRDLIKHKAGWDIPLTNHQEFTDAIQSMIDMDDRGFKELSMGARSMASSYIASNDFKTDYSRLFSI